MEAIIKKIFAGSLIAAGLSANANATIYQVQFSNSSTELASNDTDEDANFLAGFSGVFATLTFNSNTNTFDILANNVNGAFGNGTRVTGIAFDSFQNTGTLPTNGTSVSGTSGVASSGIGRSTSQLPSGSGNSYEFKYEISGSGEIANGENLLFTLVGFNPTCLTATSAACTLTSTPLSAFNFALRVNAPGSGNESWYRGALINANGGTFAQTSLAVPEPETYAMFMAGLGLLGFASRRQFKS